MAYNLRAYYEQETNAGITDRIEILEDGGTASVIQLEANNQGFRHRLSEITSESDKGLINPLANKIQIGKLTFWPSITTTAEETLLDDILGSPDTTFRIVWKQDGTTKWTGNIDNKKRSFPETGGPYFAQIRANDFEILKGIDYTLDDTRQTLITTIADLLGNLNFGLDIRTATSWITEDTTDTTDFLSQIYHETKALREFGRTGDESPQPISVFEALERVADCALLIRQVNGEFTVEQLTEFDDPANVHETVYDSTGSVTTATTTVDRRLDADKSLDNGTLVIKDGSQNDYYPAIKRAKVNFEHRNRISGILFPEEVEFTDSDSEQYEEPFISDGNQSFRITGLVRALMRTGATDASASLEIRIVRTGLDDYYLDETGDNWIKTGTGFADLELTDMGGDVWQKGFDILTPQTPPDADGVLRVSINSATASNTMPSVAHTTFWRDLALEIRNINSSVSVDYQITQSDGYSTNFELSPTWFGDGPNSFAVSALRYGTANNEVTETSWQRRGTTTGYRKFHENLLKEILDLQRSNNRKINASFWGTYDPSKILVYDSQNFYCAGVTYTGHAGRWSANLYRINVQTGSDDFQEILKYADENVESSTPSSPPSEGGDGISASEGDERWANESANLSDLDDAATALQNLGLTATATELNRLDGTLSTVQANLGLKDGSADLDFNSLVINQSEDGPILTNGRTNAPRALTVQPTGGDAPGSVEVFPSGTGGRSHFIATNNNDLDNFGFVEFEVNQTDAWMHAATKGTAPTVVDNFRFYGFSNGVKFDNAVTIGANKTPVATLDVEHTADDFTGLRMGNFADASFDTGIYLRTNGVGKIRTGISGALHFEGPAGVDVFQGKTAGSGSGRVNVSGSVEIGRFLDSTSSASVADILAFDDTTYSARFFADRHIETFGDLHETNFSSGWLAEGGQGYGITQDPNATTQWNAEFNNLLIRGRLKVFELIVKQIATLGGTEILSVAVAEADSVSGSAGSETVTITDPRGFGGTSLAADDLVIVQRVDINDTTVVKQEFRTVSSKTGTDVTFTSTSGAPAPVDAIEPGDIIVAYGNTTNTARQNMMYRSVEGELVSRFQSGVSSYSDFNSPGATSNLIMGDLTDAPTLSNGTDPSSEFGFYAKGSAYLEGEIVAQSGQIADFTIENSYLYNTDVLLGDHDSSTTQLMAMGMWDTGSYEYPRMLIKQPDGSDAINIFSNPTAGNFGVVFKNPAGDTVARLGDVNKIANTYFNERYMWGPKPTAADPTDPTVLSDIGYRLDSTTGQIYYEAMALTVYSRETTAPIGTIGSAPIGEADNIQDEYYLTQTSSTSSGVSSEEKKIRTTYRHRFGLNNLLISYHAQNDVTGDGSGFATINLYVKTKDNTVVASGSVDTGTTSDTEETFSIDISSLTPGQYYLIEVGLEAQVGNVNSGTVTVDSYLREDAIIYATT